MNRNLIKQYQAEFNYWLNGEELLYYTETEELLHKVVECTWDLNWRINATFKTNKLKKKKWQNYYSFDYPKHVLDKLR